MTADSYFSPSYDAARARFLAAAAAAGAAIESVQHPLRGPSGERLFCDVARLGDPRAAKAIVSMSATHGVEGHCGSGVQVAAFRERLFTDLPRDTCAVAIHAINPHGFAWSRRVTEDNVDLNRNFVDHGAPYPRNAGYEELREAICPALWTPQSRAAAGQRFAAYGKTHGPMALQQAISGGQYGDAQGIFFGGHAPTWSNRTMIRIFAALATYARDIAVVDYHTGLGPYGYGEPIAPKSSSDESFRRVCAWIGANEVTSPDNGTSTSAPLVGINTYGMRAATPGARLTMIALEYGVKPLLETLDAVRADNWLHQHAVFDDSQWRAMKQQMRDVFYGDEPGWKRMIVDRGFDITRRMMAGLAKV